MSIYGGKGYKDIGSIQRNKKQKKIWWSIYFILLLCIAGIALTVTFFLGPLVQKKQNENENTDSTSYGKNYYVIPERDDLVIDEETGEKYADNMILISAMENAKYADIESLVKTCDGEIVGWIEAFDEYQVKLSKKLRKDELESLITKLTESTFIEAVSLEYAMNMSEESYSEEDDEWEQLGGDTYEPNDPWEDSEHREALAWNCEAPDGHNWGLEAIKAPFAWGYRDEMSPITIGLIDGGFEDHPDLTFSWMRCSQTSEHGCHVAGIMAADMDNGQGLAGVMPTKNSNGERLVSLIGIKSNGDGFGEFFTFEFKSAFAELLSRNTKVINISQGFNWRRGDSIGWDRTIWKDGNITEKAKKLALSYGRVIESFLYRCLLRGYDFLIVCSAGNDGGIDAKYNSPLTAVTLESVVDHILVVGAISNLGLDNQGKHKGYMVAEYSDLGDRVDIMAPGTDIYSCSANGKYAVLPGTSMASPHAAGVAAVAWALSPSFSGKEVKELIVSSGNPLIRKDEKWYRLLNARECADIAYLRKIILRKMNNSSEPQNGVIVGRVYTANTNQPINKAIVYAESKEKDGRVNALTDQYGQYELFLEDGVYDLTAEADGFKSKSISGIRVENGQVNYNLEWFKLDICDDVMVIGIETPQNDELITEKDEKNIIVEKEENYDRLLKGYRQAAAGRYNENDLKRENMNPLLASKRHEAWSYAIYDINADGIPEFIVGVESKYGGVDIYDLFTLDPQKGPIRLYKDAWMNSAYITEGGNIYALEYEAGFNWHIIYEFPANSIELRKKIELGYISNTNDERLADIVMDGSWWVSRDFSRTYTIEEGEELLQPTLPADISFEPLQY